MTPTTTLATGAPSRPYEWIHRAVENREAVRLMDPNGDAAAQAAQTTPPADAPSVAAWLIGLALAVVLVPALLLAAERVRRRWRSILAWRPRRDPLERAFRAARLSCALDAGQIAELRRNAAGAGGQPPIVQLLAPSTRAAPPAVADATVETKPAPPPAPTGRPPTQPRRSPRISSLVAGSAKRLAPRPATDAPGR